MRINLCVYSDIKYERPKKALLNFSKMLGFFDNIFEYDRKWLETTDFYIENKETLDDQTRGGGWWLWKPYVIIDALTNIQEGDIVLYLDTSDVFTPSIKDFLLNHFKSNDLMLSLFGEHPNYKYCKRDTFIRMGCDLPRFWSTKQLEAGVIAVKKNDRSMRFVTEWLEWCRDPVVLKDYPTITPNYPGFIDHRHDQSILTILSEKNSVVPLKDIRFFTICNIWESLFIDDQKSEFYRKVDVCRMYMGNDADFWNEHYLKILLSDA